MIIICHRVISAKDSSLTRGGSLDKRNIDFTTYTGAMTEKLLQNVCAMTIERERK